MVRLGWSIRQVLRTTIPQLKVLLTHFPAVDAFSSKDGDDEDEERFERRKPTNTVLPPAELIEAERARRRAMETPGE